VIAGPERAAPGGWHVTALCSVVSFSVVVGVTGLPGLFAVKRPWAL
jgi:hypothetical protein